MGCVHSKIIARTGRVQKEVSQRYKRRPNSLEDLLISKNGVGTSAGGGDQFLALLYTANTVARKLKSSSLKHEPGTTSSDPQDKLKDSVTIRIEDDNTNPQPPPAPEPTTNIETINTWELLDGLEDDKGGEEEEEGGSGIELSSSVNSHKIEEQKSFRTVEDYDAMVVVQSHSNDIKNEPKSSESVTNQQSSGNPDKLIRGSSFSKRKGMARELAALRVPAAFEFSRTGSLREWLRLGGQVFSPGSYVTPKFGHFVFPGPDQNEHGDGDEDSIFDPELVKQFEEAMEELTMEEEDILRRIVDSLEGGDAEDDALQMEEAMEDKSKNHEVIMEDGGMSGV